MPVAVANGATHHDVFKFNMVDTRPPEPPVSVHQYDKADSLADCGNSCLELRKFVEAERLLRRAVELLDTPIEEGDDMLPEEVERCHIWVSVLAQPGSSAKELRRHAHAKLLEAQEERERQDSRQGSPNLQGRSATRRDPTSPPPKPKEESFPCSPDKAPGAAGWKKAVIGVAATGPKVLMYIGPNGDSVYQPPIVEEVEQPEPISPLPPLDPTASTVVAKVGGVPPLSGVPQMGSVDLPSGDGGTPTSQQRKKATPRRTYGRALREQETSSQQGKGPRRELSLKDAVFADALPTMGGVSAAKMPPPINRSGGAMDDDLEEGEGYQACPRNCEGLTDNMCSLQ